MEDADHRRPLGFASSFARLLPPPPPPPPPSLVSFSPFSPIPSSSSTRRLSGHFTPSRPVPSARRLAWVSLQGRIVDAEEASSATAIGGSLSPEQTVAWELFTPIQRFLIVAVIGVAVAESKKNKLISQLKKSVDLRDQVLSSMQQKLDDLCEQVNSIKNHAGAQPNASLDKNAESPPSYAFGCDKIKFIECGCWHCDYHQNLFAGLTGNSVVKVSGGDEVLQYKMPLVDEVVEHDERRMSDLSDWASSVTSTADIQMNMSAVDQDILNLKKECEEKDATIKELTAIIESTNMAGSKRTAELEDIIRRKNTMIVKLKKDITVLEQKLVHLTRLRRPSSSLSKSDSRQLPLMMENIVYDMDSNITASSSDSDSSPKNRTRIPVVKNQIQHSSNTPSYSDSNSDYSSFTQEQVTAVQIQETPQNTDLSPRQTQKSDSPPCSDSNSDYSYFTQQVHDVQIQERTPKNTDLSPRPTRKSATARGLGSSSRLNGQHAESRSASPRKEKSTIQKSVRISSLRPKQLSASGEFKKIRRRAQTSDAAPKKRWM